MKEKLKVLSKKWWFWVIVVCLFLFVMSDFFGDDGDEETDTEVTSGTIESNTATGTDAQQPKLGDKNNPHVLEADTWYTEHRTGTSNKEYLGSWVRVSGTVLSISDHGTLKGYYLAGGTGKGLVCWVYDDDGSVQYGQVFEYLGMVTVEDSTHIEISEGSLISASWPQNKPKSPVTISEWNWTTDYFGGVEWNFILTNNTEKTIKYVTMEWDCYNAVGDLIYDDFSKDSSHGILFTGPLEPAQCTEVLRNTTLFYNHSYHSAKLTKLKVEFMDGTIIYVNDEGYSGIFS